MSNKIYFIIFLFLILALLLLFIINSKSKKNIEKFENFITDNLDLFLKQNYETNLNPESNDEDIKNNNNDFSITKIIDNVSDGVNDSNKIDDNNKTDKNDDTTQPLIDNFTQPSIGSGSGTCNKSPEPNIIKPTSNIPLCDKPKPQIREKIIYKRCREPLPNKEAMVKINLKDYIHKDLIPEPVDLSKYILKTEIEACPKPVDLNKYILKTEIKECPNLNNYILKSEIPKPEECLESNDKYVLKSSVPVCPDCICPQNTECPQLSCPQLSCPPCPTPCPDVKINCKKPEKKTNNYKYKNLLSLKGIDRNIGIKKKCVPFNDINVYKNDNFQRY